MTYTIYSKADCPNCEEAKGILKMKNLGYVVKQIGRDITLEEFKDLFPTARSVPQIINGTTYIGGLQELKKHFFMT